MAAALIVFLIGCLLQGSLCEQVNIPQTIKVLSGSCVTIPCFFDIRDNSKLDESCKAIWNANRGNVVFDSSNPQNSAKGKLTGDLRKKDCTTTLNKMQPQDSRSYFFRLECNDLKYSFSQQQLEISVKDDPPRPTLTPSTLTVSEGTSVSLNCSAPAPCMFLPPTLTWTLSLVDSRETLQENQDKTKVNTTVLTFTASRLHHTKEISCTAVYHKQDGSTESSVSTSLIADILFAPQILLSSDCTRAADQLNCSCETVGNPFPTLQWYLDGLPVNNSSDKFTISNGPLNDTGLRSIVTVSQPQWRNLSTLLCRSSNSLGSATQQFHVCSIEPKTSAEDLVTLAVFINIVVALLILVCALLLFIRAQKTHSNLPKSTVAMSQLLTSGEGNKVPNTTEEDIYVNISAPRQADAAYPAAIPEPNSANLPSSGPSNAERASKSSEKKKEDDSAVIYSHVIWKSKSDMRKGEDVVDMDQPGSSYFKEERCMMGGMDRYFASNTLKMGSLCDEVDAKT